MKGGAASQTGSINGEPISQAAESMKNEFLKRVRAEIDLDAAEKNYLTLKGFLYEDFTKPACVIKADAYGHGDVRLMKLYSELGADFFCVSNVPEALKLRENGCEGDILILSRFAAGDADALAKNNIIGTVVSLENAEKISKNASSPVRLHIKIDTGMGRVGLCASDAEACADEIERIVSLPNISAEGIFTHLAAADSRDKEDIAFTEEQRRRFIAVFLAAEKRGITFTHKHFLNSAGTIFHYDSRSTLARLGIVLYGLKPAYGLMLPVELTPVMSLKSVVSMVKTVHKGDSVSYGRTYTADSDRVIATVPCGYADGYSRLLSGKCEALIRGKRAKGVGRICMDQMMFDVTDIEGTSAGDTVTLIGTDGSETITADDLAELYGTIGYEVVCGISKRVPRVYIRGGVAVYTEQ